MNTMILPLVNWGLGTLIIVVFAVVCLVLVAVIYNLSRESKTSPPTSEMKSSAETNSTKTQ